MIGTAAIPILTTEHLTLRGHTVADLDASVAMWAEPSIVRFISGIPSTRKESWGRLLRSALAWGDRTWSPPHSNCLIAPDNVPSIRLAQKNGFVEVGEIDNKSHPTLVFNRS